MALFTLYSCLLDYYDSNRKLHDDESCRVDLDMMEKMCVALKRISNIKEGVVGPRIATNDLLSALQRIIANDREGL